MEGSNNNVKFNSAAYFSTPVWTAHAPVFLTKMLKLSDGYFKKTQKKIMNKSIKEELPDKNVYGNINIRDTNNEFASGEMKNSPVFEPYINQKVFPIASNKKTVD